MSLSIGRRSPTVADGLAGGVMGIGHPVASAGLQRCPRRGWWYQSTGQVARSGSVSCDGCITQQTLNLVWDSQDKRFRKRHGKKKEKEK